MSVETITETWQNELQNDKNDIKWTKTVTTTAFKQLASDTILQIKHTTVLCKSDVNYDKTWKRNVESV